ncbi:hypothetical protein B6R18_13155 [Escherichia coli]|nr:hypothetical protein [Escherichia coli]EEV5782402.1 hypothetical protein [Escherichia coli]EEV8735202.1 hypothetical protein [Escherichia coli]EEW2509173.1 hypothetical protein [Escherichia coli]EEX2906392.1 hypothetical protein [Escherichia coli]
MSIKAHYFHWLQYRYYLFSKTLWAKMHCYLSIAYKLLLGIHKSSRIKLVKFVTFRLLLKVFYLCNFCFERCGFFLIRAHHLNERYAFKLNRRKL